MESFFITGLPRSRTKWFSEYFSQSGAPCLHDPVGYCTKEDLYALVESGVGISDSGLWITDLVQKYPEVPLVVIQRSVSDSRAALGVIGIQWSNVLLRALKAPSRALLVPFEDIDARIEEIHQFCTSAPFRRELADMMKDTVIKQDSFSICEASIVQWS